jgi:hypothetical protein
MGALLAVWKKLFADALEMPQIITFRHAVGSRMFQ